MKKQSRESKLRQQGKPVLPTKRQKGDPTKQGAIRKTAIVDTARRYRDIAKAIAPVIQQFLRDTPKEVIRTNNLKVNKQVYNYDVNPITLAEIIRFMGTVFEQYLNVDPSLLVDLNFWLSDYTERSYERGAQDTLQSAKNISTASSVGSQRSQEVRRFTIDQMVSDPTFQRRVGLIKARVFENMKGLTMQSKSDLGDTLARGMINGFGVKDITNEIISRIGVSERRAEKIARTEINNAYRTSTRQETRALNDTLFAEDDFEMKMLWISALSPTTRDTHAARHGNTYTPEEVASFYSQDANAINCLCSQVPVFVDKKTGNVIQEETVAMLREERKQFRLANNSKKCSCC